MLKADRKRAKNPNMTMRKTNRKGAEGLNAQQKTGPVTANSPRILRHAKALKVLASRKVHNTNAGTEVKGKKEVESPADQNVKHPTRRAGQKQQRQERLDRRRQSIIGSEDHTPPSQKPKRKVKIPAASPTDQSKESSNTPRGRHTEEDPRSTNQTHPTPNPVPRRSSLDHLIETAPEAHKDGYRAMKYSYRLIYLIHTIHSENPGISVFDGVVEHLDFVQNELERIIEQSRRDYDAEVDQDRISPREKDGKREKRASSEDRSGASVNTRARKRVCK